MNPHGRMATDPQGASIFGQDLLPRIAVSHYPRGQKTPADYYHSKLEIALKID